jgi:CubicO group peptidase (beta-lactamase class C family)
MRATLLCRSLSVAIAGFLLTTGAALAHTGHAHSEAGGTTAGHGGGGGTWFAVVPIVAVAVLVFWFNRRGDGVTESPGKRSLLDRRRTAARVPERP